jgi:hypothetical protein
MIRQDGNLAALMLARHDAAEALAQHLVSRCVEESVGVERWLHDPLTIDQPESAVEDRVACAFFFEYVRKGPVAERINQPDRLAIGLDDECSFGKTIMREVARTRAGTPLG